MNKSQQLSSVPSGEKWKALLSTRQEASLVCFESEISSGGQGDRWEGGSTQLLWGQCGAQFMRAGAEMDSEEARFPSPDTSDTLGVSEPLHWVSASGRRAAFFLSRPGVIFGTLGHRREIRAWGLCHTRGRQHANAEHGAHLLDRVIPDGSICIRLNHPSGPRALHSRSF